MGLIQGIHHVAMKCCNETEYQKVIDFYKNVLELPVAREWETGIMFSAGDALLEIFNNGQTQLETGVIRHFALATNDVDACVDAVTAAGYEVFLGPKDIAILSTPEFPARIAFCYGPLGEEIEFFQEK